MATIVCQNLQSSIDSQMIEPRTLRLRLSSPKLAQISQIPLEFASKPCFLDSNRGKTEEKKENITHVPNSNADVATCWGSLNSMSNGGGGRLSLKEAKTEKEQSIYVHPLVKRSSFCKLSEKSLELCTENLGSETGTETIKNMNGLFSTETASYSQESGNSQEEQRLTSVTKRTSNKTINSRNFPPPLTTISGADSIQVRPHREDGRLIIKAVKAPSTRSVFQVDRSNGRLRMCFVRDSPESSEAEEDSMKEEAENEVNCGGDEEEEEEEEDVMEEEEEDAEEETEEREGVNGKNKELVGEQSRINNFKRTCRCNEVECGTENRGLLNLESFWVAT